MNASTVSYLALTVAVSWGAACEPADHVVGELEPSRGGATYTDQNTGIGGSTFGTASVTGGASVGGKTSTEGTGVGGTTVTTSVVPNCDSYRDTTEEHSVDIVIKNTRSTPVYIGNRTSTCFNDDTIRINDASGTKVDIEHPDYIEPWTRNTCSCDSLMGEGSCGVYSCLRSPLRRIEPNGSIVLTWSGRYYEPETLPKECARQEVSSLDCARLTQAPSGVYRVVVTGSTGYECAWEEHQQMCPCIETDSCPSGSMLTFQGTGELLEPSVEFDLLSTKSVTVSFAE
ncbi:MAG: hypothetical protein QM784_09150 [Polyangiaceae bacterium]